MPIEEPSVEDRESVRAVVKRLSREYLVMTREFERVCQDRQKTYLTAIQLSEWLEITNSTLVKWRRNGPWKFGCRLGEQNKPEQAPDPPSYALLKSRRRQTRGGPSAFLDNSLTPSREPEAPDDG